MFQNIYHQFTNVFKFHVPLPTVVPCGAHGPCGLQQGKVDEARARRAPAAHPPPGRSALEGPPPSRPRPRAQPACTSAFGQADRLLLAVGATLVRCSKLQVFRRPSENVVSECVTCRISSGFSVTIQQRAIAANALCSTSAVFY